MQNCLHEVVKDDGDAAEIANARIEVFLLVALIGVSRISDNIIYIFFFAIGVAFVSLCCRFVASCAIDLRAGERDCTCGLRI